jgi:choline dehydrogenase-like flavoprotein
MIQPDRRSRRQGAGAEAVQRGLFDLAEKHPVSPVRTDVCVIGAGAAGLTIARRLLAAGHSVTVLESGGLDYEPDTAALNAGENVGEPYYELENARLRFFGGTTAIWGGRCAELEPVDFQRRSWVSHSGWPISFDEVAPYYAEARRLFELPSDPMELDHLTAAGIDLPQFDGSLLQTKLWAFDGRFNRFVFDSCRDLRDHPRCTLIIHASLTEIVPAESGRSITSVEARSLNGHRLTVQARAFVLAAGGIENPRLLLASRALSSAGLGNTYDQVGRYFMEHPHARGGRLISYHPWAILKMFGRPHLVNGQKVALLVAPAEGLQERAGILNSSLTIVGRQPAHASQNWGMRAYERIKHDMAPTRLGRMLWMHTKRVAGLAQRKTDPLRPWLLHKLGLLELALFVRAEQAPNPASRVMLSDDRDTLGMPRVRLDWRFSAQDKDSVIALVDTLGSELVRLGLGRIERADWLSDPAQMWRADPRLSSHPLGGYHHMGTTRMSADPRQGVTDRDGRVHGIANLYVAGSSLFPTSGWANPTLTIAALALRSADRLSAMLTESPPQLRAGDSARAG